MKLLEASTATVLMTGLASAQSASGGLLAVEAASTRELLVNVAAPILLLFVAVLFTYRRARVWWAQNSDFQPEHDPEGFRGLILFSFLTAVAGYGGVSLYGSSLGGFSGSSDLLFASGVLAASILTTGLLLRLVAGGNNGNGDNEDGGGGGNNEDQGGGQNFLNQVGNALNAGKIGLGAAEGHARKQIAESMGYFDNDVISEIDSANNTVTGLENRAQSLDVKDTIAGDLDDVRELKHQFRKTKSVIVKIESWAENDYNNPRTRLDFENDSEVFKRLEKDKNFTDYSFDSPLKESERLLADVERAARDFRQIAKGEDELDRILEEMMEKKVFATAWFLAEGLSPGRIPGDSSVAEDFLEVADDQGKLSGDPDDPANVQRFQNAVEGAINLRKKYALLASELITEIDGIHRIEDTDMSDIETMITNNELREPLMETAAIVYRSSDNPSHLSPGTGSPWSKDVYQKSSTRSDYFERLDKAYELILKAESIADGMRSGTGEYRAGLYERLGKVYNELS